MKLFKYMNEEHAEKMLKQGAIRIGTLNEYKKYDNVQIGDAQEGNYLGETRVSEGTYKTQKELPGAFVHLFRITEGQGHNLPSINIKDVNAAVEITLADRNIYCKTMEASEEVMRQFGYDACVEITDRDLFYEALVTGLTRLGISNGRWRPGSCLYEGKTVDYHSPVGYWLKPASYAVQKEERLVIEPQHIKNAITPQLLNMREIISFVRIHKF